jgi:TPR repeat protein
MIKFTKNCFLAASVFYFSLSSFSFAMEDDYQEMPEFQNNHYQPMPELHRGVNVSEENDYQPMPEFQTNPYQEMPELQNTSGTNPKTSVGAPLGSRSDGLFLDSTTSSIQISNPLMNTNDAVQNPSIDDPHYKNVYHQMPELHDAAWYQKAADQGDAAAQCNLGVMYEKGRGVKKDETEAVKWFQKAADQGNAPAQFNLGFMYKTGRGVKKDETEAVKWFQKAADQGVAAAQFNLGVTYEKGYGVKKDETEAVKWFQKAADQGHAKAENLVKKLKKKLKII